MTHAKTPPASPEAHGGASGKALSKWPDDFLIWLEKFKRAHGRKPNQRERLVKMETEIANLQEVFRVKEEERRMKRAGTFGKVM